MNLVMDEVEIMKTICEGLLGFFFFIEDSNTLL